MRFFYRALGATQTPSPLDRSIYRSHSKSVNDKTRTFLSDSLHKDSFTLALNHHQRTIIAALLVIACNTTLNRKQQPLQ
jgi:hypothetical protein